MLKDIWQLWRGKIRVWWQERSRTEQRGLIAYVIVLILLLLWPADEIPPAVSPNGEVMPAAKQKTVKEKHWEVSGLAEATAGTELRDPFDPTHPTRAESEQAKAEKENGSANSNEAAGATGKNMQATVVAPIAPPMMTGMPSPTVTTTDSDKNSATCVLKGVATEGEMRLALVAVGGNMLTVAVGDVFADKTVIEIGGDYLVWQDGQGQGELRLGVDGGQ